MKVEVKIYRLKDLGINKAQIMKRSEAEIDALRSKVEAIIKDVKLRGDDALIEYSEKFDGVRIEKSDLKVNEDEIKEAYKKIDKSVLKALKHAEKNIRKFHEMLLPKEFEIEIEKGVIAGMRVIPLETAGLYVPGGKAVYPSVMLMLGIPAKVAKVKNIIACTPPRKDGIDPATIVSADMCGAEIYKVGGVQAIAAMAYGTQTIPKADVVVGPGNPYVSAAQKILMNAVKIRATFPPGPSEGMVLADETADPVFCAVDTLSEAEHGPDSAGIMVTNSFDLALKVKKNLEEMINHLPEPRKTYIAENMKKYSCIIVTENFDEAIDFVNEYAPEHLTIESKNLRKTLSKIKNAGTICLGKYTPITAGNFIVGPNAILPTGGYGKIYSGVSVDTFIKKSTYEYLTKKGLNKLRKDIKTLAEFEGFPVHNSSVEVRFDKMNLIK